MASKSFYGKSQAKGLKAEIEVIKYLESFGWNMLLQRFKGPYGEIDLIFEKADRILLIEVKSLSNPWRAFNRIENIQLNKLKLNLVFFTKKYPKEEFKLFLAWVINKNIKFVEIN